MAAGFLIMRLLLVCLLSEVKYSSAFPRARSFVQPQAWQGRGEEQVYDNGNCHRSHYVGGRDKTLQKQEGLRVPSQICRQNRPSEYPKASSPLQPWSHVATKWPKETALPQLLLQKKHLSPKPRSYEFSFNLPFVNLLVRNEERNSAEGHDGEIDVSKPGFQVSLSFPFSTAPQSANDPNTSQGGHLASLQNQESTDFVSYNYIKPENPQSSSTRIVSVQPFSNSAGTDYTEAQQQTYTPLYVTPQSSSPPAGSQWPFLHVGTTQQQTYEPYLQSRPNSAATHHQTRGPYHGKPPSSTLAGSQWPFLNSAATHHQIHGPYHGKPPSSTLAGSQWPFLNSAATHHQTHGPYHGKPPSSTLAGSQWPFLNFGTRQQQTFEPYLQSRPNAAATHHQTRGPYHGKPPSSTLAGSQWPFLNAAATHQTHEPYHGKRQSVSNQIVSQWPI